MEFPTGKSRGSIARKMEIMLERQLYLYTSFLKKQLEQGRKRKKKDG